MPLIRRLLLWALAACLLLAVAASIGLATLYYTVSGKLPDPQALRNVELQEPLYVYASDGRLIGLFGETRRYPVVIAEVPEPVKQAFIAAEDAGFYQHNGISFKGISRALWQIASRKKGRVAGGSTITQQVARQFFLSNDYKYSRKLAEMLLAMKIEKTLGKDEILELYLNKSFFGNRAYGIAAAAEFYYGKRVDELTLMETATLVSALKFPSSGNPISNPQRNHERSVYVIERMREDGYISREQAAAAKAEAMHAAPHERPVEVPAPHMAEMVRQEMIARFGGDVLTKGYSVTTTIDADAQLAADKALRAGLELYDSRRGWHGVEQHVDLAADAGNTVLAGRLADIPAQAGLVPVIVAAVNADGGVGVVDASGREIALPATAAAQWKKKPADLLKRGDITRIRANAEKPGEFVLAQVPQAQSALVSLDANSGAIHALVGGYSFAGNKFNRATQARRQPGSSFKPFIYAAALDKGFNPGSIVLDAPVVFRDRRGNEWRPQNDRGGFDGPMRLREALVRSKNLVSVRLLDTIGVQYASDYITRFGFDKAELPPNLSMSLGTASLTPLSVARGYALFANGGSQVTPWFIDEVKDRNGNLVFKETPALACHGCGGQAIGEAATPSTVVDGFDFGNTPPAPETAPRTDAPAEAASPPGPETPLAPQTIDGRTIYQLVSMMRDVVLRGTGTPARALNREDVGGKTGSTNDYRDAWFGGFGGGLSTVVWVGRDDFRSLGRGEYGGRAALPIWVDYMRVALQDRPVTRNDPPEGMVQVETNGVTEWVKIEDAERVRNEHLFDREESARDEQAFDIF